MKKNDDYSDIIHLPHHTSKYRPRMKIETRAAQFAPFAAVGHESSINEAARYVSKKKVLDDSEKEMINLDLIDIHSNIDDLPQVEIVYFKKDLVKEGGEYLKQVKKVKSISNREKHIVFIDGDIIDIEDILSIRRLDKADEF